MRGEKNIFLGLEDIQFMHDDYKWAISSSNVKFY